MADWTCKAGDTGTALQGTLLRANGSPPDLTGATVRFVMKSGETTVIDRAIPVADPAAGVVVVGFDADEISEPGSYQAEFQVTYPDRRRETFPNTRQIIIKILTH